MASKALLLQRNAPLFLRHASTSFSHGAVGVHAVGTHQYSRVLGRYLGVLNATSVLANMTNFRVQGKYRHSFWNEVYETVLAPYILGPTLVALFNPKSGTFNVTAKGGLVTQSYFDARIAWPYVCLILLNILGLLIAPVRLLYWDVGHPGTIAMNVFWILFNLVILGTANAVAFESRQRRAQVRIGLHIPFELRLENGLSIFGKSIDMSSSGARLQLEGPIKASQGSIVHVT